MRIVPPQQAKVQDHTHFVRPLSVFVPIFSLPRIDVIGGVEYDNCVCWAQSVLCFVGIDSFRSFWSGMFRVGKTYWKGEYVLESTSYITV